MTEENDVVDDDDDEDVVENAEYAESGSGGSFLILQKVLRRAISKDTTIDQNLAFTSGFILDSLIGTLHDVIRFHCRLIENAKSDIMFTTSYWEGSSMSAFMLSCSLRSVLSRRPDVRVRIVVDNGNIKNLRENVRFIRKEEYKKELGLTLDPMKDVLAKSVHIPLLGTMHAKFMVIDGEIAVLSSNNVQDRPNVELAISMKGDVCRSFLDIFHRLWNGKTNNPDLPALPVSVSVPDTTTNMTMTMLVVNRRAYGRLDRDIDTPQNCAWWTVMSLAKNTITICTPTFNARHAIEAVYNACKRNVLVTLILTKNFNDKKEAMPFQGGTNKNVVRSLQRRLCRRGKEDNLIVRWYVGKYERRPRIGVHSHVKLLVVDGRILIFGNGNMDTQSWYHSMEVNLALESPLLCKKLIDVMTRHSMEEHSMEECH